MKTAIITGITGQDAAYLAKHLLDNNYTVYGTYRRTSSLNFWRLEELGISDHPDLHKVEYGLNDLGSSIQLLEKAKPDEVYNLAAQSFVDVSFNQYMNTANITGLGPIYILEAIRIYNPDIRFYQASTSEMFGKADEVPQNELTNFHPRSPYGAAKVYAHWMTVNYRESHNIFTVSGILYNHESPLRGLEFVTRKITDGLVKIKLGKKDFIELGNLSSKRDWGYARDYVDGMYRMMQADKPDSYVLATGRAETVRNFVNMACQALEINIAWEGEEQYEVGIDQANGNKIIRINPQFYRNDDDKTQLIGDPAKAKKELGWEAETQLEELCQIMVEADMRRNKSGQIIL